MTQVKDILCHRGPDDSSDFLDHGQIYLAHNRLSIIGLDDTSRQPMHGRDGSVIVFNGEIYNYQDIKKDLVADYPFQSHADTEVILALYEKFGQDCVKYLRGMFAFAIWDRRNQTLFCARDRFGIKPFYYAHSQEDFAFASEMKALLPFINEIGTDYGALQEYFAFQYTLGEQTLFKDIKQLMPGHCLSVGNNHVQIRKYWDVVYEVDHSKPHKLYEEELDYLLRDSVKYHQVSDVPVGSYLSGGIDSSLITNLAFEANQDFYGSFHGRFMEYPGYDESQYAQASADSIGKDVFTIDITANDFIDHISKVIYHLDVPVAGPGSFPQYMVSKLASEHVKVVLGGQGGDELFGGYARYIIAYFEQCIKASIEGTHTNGNFVVTPESIIPNLTLLQEYKPMIQSFWQKGLFGPLDERYFRLIDRSHDASSEINWSLFDNGLLFDKFKAIFNCQDNVKKEAYFDKMTHFDFKCLLPALLHVEDRMSMAHGVESRVPFLDHRLVEFAATIPADLKFPGGRMKHMLKQVFKNKIPEKILHRRDKMGFPVPLKEWFSGPVRDFIGDIFTSQVATTRGFYNPAVVMQNLDKSGQFSRKVWGLLSLELWCREFHDRSDYWRSLSTNKQEEIIL